jgi:hypothetical protein
MILQKSLALTISALALSACSFHARSPEEYRDATAALLATKSADVTACYNTALKQTPGLAGTVTVHFNVEKKTGKLMNVQSFAGAGAAPSPLTDCVSTALGGLALDPPDARTGDATFEYAFVVKS